MLLSCLLLNILFTAWKLCFSVLTFKFFWSNSALVLNHRIDFGLGVLLNLLNCSLTVSNSAGHEPL